MNTSNPYGCIGEKKKTIYHSDLNPNAKEFVPFFKPQVVNKKKNNTSPQNDLIYLYNETSRKANEIDYYSGECLCCKGNHNYGKIGERKRLSPKTFTYENSSGTGNNILYFSIDL